jgi:hypothetical protein
MTTALMIQICSLDVCNISIRVDHETINVEGRFTYVTPGARVQFDRLVKGLPHVWVMQACACVTIYSRIYVFTRPSQPRE